jgi:hypothetical protein
MGTELATAREALRTLAALEREADSAKTYKELLKVMALADAIKRVGRNIIEVRQKAEWVILASHARAGDQILQVPKGAGGDRRSNLARERNLKSGRDATGVPGWARARHVKVSNARREKLLRPIAESIWATGKEATAGAVLKFLAAEETMRRRKRSREALPIADGLEFRQGDCRKVLADVPDASVPLILTDPPYGDEAEPLYQWLAQWSARVLIPGGSLICYTGQTRLDRDIAIFGSHLRYWWLLVMPHRQYDRIPGKFVAANYKPVLWYVKGHRRGRTIVHDLLSQSKKDKSAHDWGQGEAGVSQLIEDLTDPGELIADPFAGSCLWGEISAAMGRRWLGADIEVRGDTKVAAE